MEDEKIKYRLDSCEKHLYDLHDLAVEMIAEFEEFETGLSFNFILIVFYEDFPSVKLLYNIYVQRRYVMVH